jgi:hypothetical protein
MKLAILLCLCALVGCNADRTKQKTKAKNNTFIYLDDAINYNGHEHNLFTQALDDFRKLIGFFMGKKNLPTYCTAILEDSPTIEDFKGNWSMDLLHDYCGEVDADCRQQHEHALIKGFQCYQD